MHLIRGRAGGVPARLVAGLLVEGAALVLLTACTSFSSSFSSARGFSSSTRVTSTSVSSTVSGGGVSTVSCSGNRCTVTLGGTGATVEVFGSRIRLDGIRDGVARVRIGDRDLSCREGEGLSAGQLRLRCTSVTPVLVTFAGTRG